MDNEEAFIQVGQEVPIITGSTASSNNDNPFQTIERKDIGVKLKVTPQINEGDAIRLTIEQEVSSLSGIKASDIVTNKRVISTTVLVDDGATLALGGLINEDVQESSSKVPLLGDIPGIGQAFRSDGTTHVKRNLMVFIRPTIIRDQRVANSVSRQKYNYIHARQLMHAAGNPNRLTKAPPPSLPQWKNDQPSPPTIEEAAAKDPQVEEIFKMMGGDR
jgi:general secretion pathway protein D